MSSRNISKIARAEAMEGFSSSEQLDQRLVVVRGQSWLLLLIAVAMIVGALAWGILGRVPSVIEGEGIMAPQDTKPIEVDSPYAFGGVIEMIVPEGKTVEVGDPIINIRNPEIEKGLENLRGQLDTLHQEDQKLTAAEDRIIDLQKKSLDAQIKSATQTIEQTKNLVKMLQDEVESLEGLVKEQLIPRSELVSTRSTLFSSMQQLTQQESVMAQARAEHDSLVNSTEQTRLARIQEIENQTHRIAAEEIRLTASTRVLAPISGTILDHAVDIGSSIQAGALVTSIRPHAKSDEVPIRVIAFVPYGKGKKIRTGMEAQVSLPFARPSRFGYIMGDVVAVNEFVSGSSARLSIGSSTLAENLRQQIGPMLRLTVELRADEDTPTGLMWTSRKGFGNKLEFPLLCGVRVITGQDRPIDLVIPWFKDLVGIDPQPKLIKATSDP